MEGGREKGRVREREKEKTREIEKKSEGDKEREPFSPYHKLIHPYPSPFYQNMI